MEAITNTVMTWVKDNCMKDKADMELTPTTSFFATNILDSMDFLNLVEFVQEQYDVEIDEDDMSPDNFKNATTVAELIVELKENA